MIFIYKIKLFSKNKQYSLLFRNVHIFWMMHIVSNKSLSGFNSLLKLLQEYKAKRQQFKLQGGHQIDQRHLASMEKFLKEIFFT